MKLLRLGALAVALALTAACGGASPDSCQPACSGRQCGDDGCGGSCGSCVLPATCGPAGSCACVPSCSGKDCGGDGCGGSCGTCGTGTTCGTGGTCQANPPNVILYWYVKDATGAPYACQVGKWVQPELRTTLGAKYPACGTSSTASGAYEIICPPCTPSLCGGPLPPCNCCYTCPATPPAASSEPPCTWDPASLLP